MTATDGEETIVYDADADLYRVSHDWTSDADVTTTIITAVAAITDSPATDIAPLYEAINPDALNTLYAPTQTGERRTGGGCTTLTVHGCTVTLYWDGEIEIEPPDHG